MATSNRSTGEALLFLTDEQLRQGIEAMFRLSRVHRRSRSYFG